MRFVKEIGKYHFIINYITGSGKRSLKDIIRDMNQTLSTDFINDGYNFADIFHMIPGLGEEYFNRGHAYWFKNISPISSSLVNFRTQFENGKFNYVDLESAANHLIKLFNIN